MDFVPIESILRIQDFFAQYLLLNEKIKEHSSDLVKFHKDRLGKQERVFTSEFRFWIWSRPGWQVLVSNQKGICLEVHPGSSQEDCWRFWDEYLSTLGIKL